MKENFWEMGETGPCGPCSEIHFDRLGGRDASKFVNADDPTVIEIWNLVFMQFNREEGGFLKPLPAKHVDTGMGLERITSILQNVLSNYDTDVFLPIFEAIQKVTGARPYSGKLGDEDKDQVDMAYRVIADHIRTLTFAISDGAVPDNEGRGYVLRRILRRAVRYGRQILKAQPGFFSQLLDIVVEKFKGIFPELESKVSFVRTKLKEEERSFEKALDRGTTLFQKLVKKIPPGGVLSGKDVFTLYDAWGFPIDLTEIMANELNITINKEEYLDLMEQKKKNTGTSYSLYDGGVNFDVDATSHLNKLNVPPTEDSSKYRDPEYWNDSYINATILAIFCGNEFVNGTEADDKKLVGLVLDRTNFYAESGGQTFDVGVLSKGNQSFFQVTNVQVYAGYILHIGYLLQGTLQIKDVVTLQVDALRRRPTMANHTFTHVLNFALRCVLKSPSDQKGSLVDAEKLRFDFSYHQSLTINEIKRVDQICNEQIQKKLQVFSKVVPLEAARKINGLRAVFGETYPDPVKVVSIGRSVDELLKNPENSEWLNYSIEFCGGTHLKNTEEAKHFVIISESGIAKGVRRIVAWTGDQTQVAYNNLKLLQESISYAKTKQGEELSQLISNLTSDFNKLPIPLSSRETIQKQLDELIKLKLGSKKDNLQSALQKVDQFIQQLSQSKPSFVVEEFEVESDRKALSKCMQSIQEKFPDLPILLLSKDTKSLYLMATVPKSLQSKISAGEWTKEVATAIGGSGGGKPETAQGTGKPEMIDKAFEVAKTFAQKKLT